MEEKENVWLYIVLGIFLGNLEIDELEKIITEKTGKSKKKESELK